MSKFDVGDEGYDHDEFGTPWWMQRASDRAHQHAYRSVVEQTLRHVDRPPKRIIDFACGPGLLIRVLMRRCAGAEIIGIDESADAIDNARTILSKSHLDPDAKGLHLVRAALPAFDLPYEPADIAFFCFPDFRGGNAQSNINHWAKKLPKDFEATKKLRRHLKARADEDVTVSKTREMFYKRVAGRNLRSLVRPGGLMVWVDYANCNREDCEPVTLKEMDWVQGNLPVKKLFTAAQRKYLDFGELIYSRYIPSAVMEDVYQQTGDPDDKEGGFLVSVLRAQ